MRTSFVSLLVYLAALHVCGAAPERRPDILISGFEKPTYGDWQTEGTAFGNGPVRHKRGTIGSQRGVRGFQGNGLVNSHHNDGKSTGRLTSPEFRIERNHISFLVGGGRHAGKTCINLVVGGKVVRSTTGQNDDRMLWASWRTRELTNELARIEILDKEPGGWGHVLVDHILQTDRPKKSRVHGIATRDLVTKESEAKLRPLVDKLDFDEVVFAVRQNGKDGHWYANFSYWSNNPGRHLYSDAGKLCAINVRTGESRVILDAPHGSVRDPQVHYSGKKILFSYRKDHQPFYHLYEINVDGTGLRQITDGPYDDIEPAYLPDGGIVFCSSRCNRWVQCFFVRVAVVYRCDADGSNMRALSANMEHDNTPWVLPDGRILYQRWEYIDRSQVKFHHLWTMNPDGTGQMVYYGNMHPGFVMIDAKPIPNTHKVLASFCPGHGRTEHEGVMTIVDPSNGPDDRSMAKPVVPGKYFRDPYPISSDLFMAAGYHEIFLVDPEGGVIVIYELPPEWRQHGMRIQEPRPVRTRQRERILPSRVDLKNPNGHVFLEDVYVGRNMAGVKRGDIKKLLVLESLPKPVNFSGGSLPLTKGGSFGLERVLGTVPVEEDGSASFFLPAMRSILLVALDENDMSVKRMQSFMTVQPGERASCIGCHEDRASAPRSAGKTLAMGRAPSTIEPIKDVPDVFDFPRDIQPILDRHCVACHDYDGTEKGGPFSGGVILAGDHGSVYSASYVYLTKRKQFADGRNGLGNRAPRTIGSSASPLLKKLAGGHHGVKATPHEIKMARLWIEAGAPYPGTYAALGSGMVRDASDRQGYRKAYHKRCAKCHQKRQLDRFVVFNYTRPEKSLALLKPLAREAGGYGMKRQVKRDGKTVKETCSVFTDTTDPDYQAMLSAIKVEAKRLAEIKRFDMPGFRPNEHYIREMKFYGILPGDLAADAPVDPYKTDRKYWESFWYKPE